MIVKTYNAKPAHTFMAILQDSSTILHEDGKTYPIEKTPKNTRIWSSWDGRVKDIWRKEKVGEVLVYAEDPIRWRKEVKGDDSYWGTTGNWQDVYLLKTQSFPDKDEVALQSFIEWRDWVEEYDGKASGTVASVSWSLWRASLSKNFVSPQNWPKAVKHPVGGRLIPCKEEFSCYVGDFIQWDMTAAYATKLGGIKFGGERSKWISVRDMSHSAQMSANGVPVYIVAKVWVPKMDLGPLPQRRQKYSPYSYMPIHYWTNRQLYGTWTYQEIEQAIQVGCTVKIENVWVHSGGEYSFAKWWDAVKDGREHLIGFAQYLAKATGNSLWGQFAFREKKRKIRWFDEDGKRHHRIIIPRIGGRPQSPELSDHLSGQVRANLYSFIRSARGEILQANTDGVWMDNRESFHPEDTWRIKKHAKTIEFIDASAYRYWEPDNVDATYVMAGVPFDIQEKSFNAVFYREVKKLYDSLS